MVIIETSVFTRRIQELMSDEEYAELQETLATRPDMGDLIPCSGGLCKVRWGFEGRGKRGGVRVTTTGRSAPSSFACSTFTLKLARRT